MKMDDEFNEFFGVIVTVTILSVASIIYFKGSNLTTLHYAFVLVSMLLGLDRLFNMNISEAYNCDIKEAFRNIFSASAYSAAIFSLYSQSHFIFRTIAIVSLIVFLFSFIYNNLLDMGVKINFLDRYILDGDEDA